MLSLPSSLRTRTIFIPIAPDWEWVATTAPPRPSTSVARSRGVQVLAALTVVGTQVGQMDPGRLASVLGTWNLHACKARYGSFWGKAGLTWPATSGLTVPNPAGAPLPVRDATSWSTAPGAPRFIWIRPRWGQRE